MALLCKFNFTSFFTSLYQKGQLKSIRQILRGYRLLRNRNQLSAIAEIKQDLTLCKIEVSDTYVAKKIFGTAIDTQGLILNQYLLFRIGGIGLNKALLLSIANGSTGIIYHMPLEWRKVIEKHGFKVNHLLSECYWRIYCFYQFLNGLLQITTTFLTSIKSILKREQPPENYVYFANLKHANLPKNSSKSYDIISWYLQWSGRQETVDKILHGVSEVSSQSINGVTLSCHKMELPVISSYLALLKYCIWAFKIAFLASLSLPCSRWYSLLILSEAAKREQAKLTKSSYLAKSYFFHMSDWCYRPMWTYEAEKKGSEVFLYFYATNCEGIHEKKSTKLVPYGYYSMSWPNYLVWDKHQARFIRSCVGDKANVSIVGPIWFSDQAYDYILPHKSIVVFDVQPFRDVIYTTLGLDFEYYTPKNCNRFLSEIYDVINSLSSNMILKRKRQADKSCHASYRKKVLDLSKRENFTEIDANSSASRLIKNASAVISMPFTSTAHIAKHQGVPSVYYDPSGLLERNDPASHGIDILSNKCDLKKWLEIVTNQT